MLKYAYDENKNIVPIAKAQKQTDYYCPECEAVLRIKDGEIKCKHYFHLNVGDCGATGESQAHKYFKEHITDFIDEIEIEYNTFGGKQTEVHKIISFETEQRLPINGTVIVPDVLATLDNGEQIAIEVYYSHKKDEIDVDKYNQLNMIAVEIEIDIDMEILDIKTIAHPKQFKFDSLTYVIKQVMNADYDVEQLDYFIQKLIKEKERKERIIKMEERIARMKENEQLQQQLIENGDPLIFYNPFNDKEIAFDDIKVYKDENDEWQLAKPLKKGGFKKLNKHQGTNDGRHSFYYWNVYSEKIYELDLQSLNNGYLNRKDFVEKTLNGISNDDLNKVLKAIFKTKINDFLPKDKQTPDIIKTINKKIEYEFDKMEKDNDAQDIEIALLMFNFKNKRSLDRNYWYGIMKRIAADTIGKDTVCVSDEQRMLIKMGLLSLEDIRYYQIQKN